MPKKPDDLRRPICEPTYRPGEAIPGFGAIGILLERERKLQVLLEHHELGSDDWKELAYRLACEHEPGFQITNLESEAPGRPRKWSAHRMALLVKSVEDLRKNGLRTDRAALRKLAKGGAFKRSKSSLTDDKWVGTLEKRLNEGRKQLKQSHLVFTYKRDAIEWDEFLTMLVNRLPEIHSGKFRNSGN